MRNQLKILIDENIGRPITKSIACLVQWHHLKPEIKHVLELQEQGVSDDVWLEHIASEKWIVISADRGRKYGGPKFPRICAKRKITHILIGASLHQAKQFEKARAIVSLIPTIVDLWNNDEKRGKCFSMRYNTAKNFVLKEKS